MDFLSGGRLFGNKQQEQPTQPAQQRSVPPSQPVPQGQRMPQRPISNNPNMQASVNQTPPQMRPNVPNVPSSNPTLSQNMQQTRQPLSQPQTSSVPQNPEKTHSETDLEHKNAYVQPRPTLAQVNEPEALGLINDVKFSDVYVTPDKKCYIWSGKTDCGLKLVTFEDFPEFFAKMESLYKDNRSYLLNYKNRNYRVERTVALEGPQYCARKMPIEVPDLKQLGFPSGVYSHLISLAGCSGLILLAGATGSGKSTTVSALLKEYLERKGGYAFTIEDPIELPLDGVYPTRDGELGLCKQTTPPDGSWEEGIKSALRSKPRYIYLGEIRSPDVASEALRAATSGHLVLSTIHANNVSDAINALVKYAASSGISEEMAYELVANGFLGCIHQILTGAPKRAVLTYLFANPDVNAGCQVRGMLRSGKLNMATLIDQQRVKLEKNLPIFSRF